MIWVVCVRWFHCPQTSIHLCSNQPWNSTTVLIETNMLTTTLTANVMMAFINQQAMQKRLVMVVVVVVVVVD